MGLGFLDFAPKINGMGSKTCCLGGWGMSG